MRKFAGLVTALFATAMVFALVSVIEPSKAREPKGYWIAAIESSCELVCRAHGRGPFVAGQYNDGGGNYLVCRGRWVGASSPTRGRPGFQHQEGSPNVCKVQGASALKSFDCLCK